MAMPDIPMYVFTGFLESGKTKFIQQTLEDERFNTGERTLLLVFEEGEEEYDVSAYPHKEVYEQVLDYEDLSPELLTDLQKKYRAERVVVELNGMHLAADFYLKTPDHWKIAQEVMFANATTFLSYNANMRQLVVGFNLIRIALPAPRLIPFASLSVFVTNRSSPTSCTLSPSLAVSFCHPSQSSSSRPSSMEMIGYFSHNLAQCSMSSSDVYSVPAFGSL